MDHRKKILIADHLEHDTEDVRQALIAAGYEVRVVKDGRDITEWLNSFGPDLVLVEAKLTNLDFPALIRAIRNRQRQRVIPIVTVSIPRTIDERVDILELDIDDFIYKPFEAEEVLVRLENLLREAEQSQDQMPSSLPGFNGTLAEMPLVDLLQTLEVGKKNAIITLTRENVEGKTYVTEGQVADAVLGNIDPQRALLRMFTWNEGSFSVSITKHERPAGDFLPTSDLISEGITRLYRWEQLSKTLPPLKCVVLTVPGIGEAKLTADERKVVALLNGPKRFIDVIEESRFDEIKTLRLLKALYEKGLIIESPNDDNEITEDYLEKHRAHAQNGSTAAQTLEGIFSTLLRKPDSPRQNSNDGQRMERRGTDRRRYDRRRGANRGGTKICLNKSELLILREKLLSQIKEQSDSKGNS